MQAAAELLRVHGVGPKAIRFLEAELGARGCPSPAPDAVVLPYVVLPYVVLPYVMAAESAQPARTPAANFGIRRLTFVPAPSAVSTTRP